MMKTFDMLSLRTFPFSERDKNVFYKTDKFKMRIIELNANQELPECEMKSHVIFFIVKGEVEVYVNNQLTVLSEGKCLVSGPAVFSMKAIKASRLVGIQINKSGGQ